MDEKMRKKVMTLALPAIIANILFTFQMIADTIMLGRYPPEEVSLTALGLGNTLFFVFFPLVMGLVTGMIAIVSRRWGEGNYKEAACVASDSMTALLFISIPIALIGFFFGPDIIVYLGAEDQVLTEGSKYIRAIFTFYPFSVFVITHQGMLFAAGDTKTPLYVNAVANIYNVVLNYLLIFGHFGFPELGVLGAGISTGTSYILAAAIFTVLRLRNKLIIAPICKPSFHVRLDNVKKMFNIGVPAGVDMGMWAISSFLVTPLILTFGAVGYSAFLIGLRAEAIAYMPAIGFGIAATTLTGQFLGAKREDKARNAVLTSTKLVIIFMAAAGTLLVIFSTQIAMVFTSDKEVIGIASVYLFLMGFSEPFLGAVFTLGGGMRGAGYTRVPLLINFSGLIVLRLSLIYILAFELGMGLLGVWITIVIETVYRAIAFYIVFRKGDWLKVKV